MVPSTQGALWAGLRSSRCSMGNHAVVDYGMGNLSTTGAGYEADSAHIRRPRVVRAADSGVPVRARWIALCGLLIGLKDAPDRRQQTVLAVRGRATAVDQRRRRHAGAGAVRRPGQALSGWAERRCGAPEGAVYGLERSLSETARHLLCLPAWPTAAAFDFVHSYYMAPADVRSCRFRLC